MCDTMPISNLSELWLPRVSMSNNNNGASFTGISGGANDVNGMKVLCGGKCHIVFLSCVAAFCFSGANSQSTRRELWLWVLIKCLPNVVLSPVCSTLGVGWKAGGGRCCTKAGP